MFAPPVAAAASSEQPMEKPLASESTPSQLVFPNEFPYEFAFTSPENLTETEDVTNAVEDDFLAGLTRRLALFTQRLPSPPPIDKAKVNSTESTRSGLGSSGNKSPNGPFSQALSPPETPCREEDSLKVTSSATGEVAKIKVAKPNSRPNPKPNSFPSFPQNAAFYNYHYSYYYYYWLRQPQAALDTYHYPVNGVFAAPNAVKQPSPGTGVITGPTAVKQPSTGTGVFLPRNNTNPSFSRKKGGGGSVKLPKKIVQTQHSKTEKLPGRCQSRTQARLSVGGSKLDRATKSSVTGGCLKEERHLPQEWMY